MKKVVKLFWQLTILPILYVPYRILNETVLINILGCGCPTDSVDVAREIIDANDFTKLFFTFVSIAIIVISVYKVKNISKVSFKVIYMVSIVCICIFVANIFCQSMMWK